MRARCRRICGVYTNICSVAHTFCRTSVLFMQCHLEVAHGPQINRHGTDPFYSTCESWIIRADEVVRFKGHKGRQLGECRVCALDQLNWDELRLMWLYGMFRSYFCEVSFGSSGVRLGPPPSADPFSSPTHSLLLYFFTLKKIQSQQISVGNFFWKE